MEANKNAVRLARQLIIVALGVFLALMGNNLIEGQKGRNNAERVVDGLRKEMIQNRELIVESLDLHRTFMSQVAEGKEDLDLALNFASIDQSAWEAAKNSEVLHLLDYDLSFAFSEVYSWHARYDKLRFLSDQALYFIRFSNHDLGDSYLERWQAAFRDFQHAEEELLKRYNSAISLIALIEKG